MPSRPRRGCLAIVRQTNKCLCRKFVRIFGVSPSIILILLGNSLFATALSYPVLVKHLSHLKFRLIQLQRTHGWSFAVLSAGMLLVLFSAGSWIAMRKQVEEAAAERTMLARRPVSLLIAAQPRIAEPELPIFVASHAVETFTRTALDVGLPVDEVTYALEGSNDQPYRRYRISMSVKTGYPEVRRFVAALAAGMPNVTLDIIRCTRDNAAAQALGCQLVFSAFYQRASRG